MNFIIQKFPTSLVILQILPSGMNKFCHHFDLKISLKIPAKLAFFRRAPVPGSRSIPGGYRGCCGGNIGGKEREGRSKEHKGEWRKSAMAAWSK